MPHPVRPIPITLTGRDERGLVAPATPSKEATDLIKPTFDVHVGTPTWARGTGPINRLSGYVSTAARGQEFAIV
jgi:hypothetical protein